ncbi:B-cell receptor CD22-like isoform X2 [Phyllopteryx taeniolatus]|uniref:B-cell receptor CD22-like isoform X2 n=1 Tax=Phyllopteryx taeniolatus TaxID=161469 RepID=UPI002AD29EF5|nr:B-cell receptor CD22-like isoform X2 [Phyllopteryx taeniolatus]
MTHVVAVKLILLYGLLEGSLCQEWATMLPSSVQGVSGSCIHIPCRFTIPPVWDSYLDRTCAAIWRRGYSRSYVFDSSRTREESANLNLLQGNLTGNLLEKDCSTILEDMTSDHYDSYFFRLECDNSLKFNFDESVVLDNRDSAPRPTITRNADQVEEGTAMALECGAPAPCPTLPPLLTWAPLLGTVTEAGKAEVEEAARVTAVMNFNATYLHNRQRVTCSAIYKRQSGYMELSTERTMTLQVLHGPKNTSVSYVGPVTAGTWVTLTCNTIANPSVNTYTWYRVDAGQGTVVENRKRHLVRVTEDSPTFYCRVRNTYGEQNSSVTTIDVQFPPKDTTVIVQPTDVILEGTTVFLLCQSRAKPPVYNYSWAINGGEDLEIGDILTLDGALPRHSGEYRCKAKNLLGEETSTPVQLDVQYPPKNTSVSVSPPGSLPDGSTVTLGCTSIANPPVANVTWYRVNAGERSLMGLGQEIIFNVTKLSQDTFYCENVNVHGAQSAQPIAINVTFRPEILASSRCQDVSTQMRCFCDSQANPPPSLHWELSGVLVNDSDQRPVTEEALDSATRRSVITLERLDSELVVSSLICFSFNPLGFDSFAFNMSSPAPQTDVVVLVGSAVGVTVMLILSLLLLLYICRKTKGNFPPRKGRADNAADFLVTNESTSAHANAIYANNDDLAKEAVQDEEQLHYANVNIVMQARDHEEIRGLSSVTGEYAEIRLRSTGSDKGGELELKMEPESEQETKMAEDTFGQQVASEEVVASTQ